MSDRDVELQLNETSRGHGDVNLHSKSYTSSTGEGFYCISILCSSVHGGTQNSQRAHPQIAHSETDGQSEEDAQGTPRLLHGANGSQGCEPHGRIQYHRVGRLTDGHDMTDRGAPARKPGAFNGDAINSSL